MIALLLFAVQATTSSVPAAPPPVATVVVAPVDPARLAAGRRLAAKIVPDGTYQRLMNGQLGGMTTRMMDGMFDMPVRQLVGMGGLSQADLAKLGNGTVRQIMAILDPHFQERTQLTMKAMFEGMGSVFARLEPDLREGIATAYARRFDSDQLAEINHFFDGPTGAAFASQQLTLMTDPAVVEKMQAMIPALLKQMPEVVKKAQAATAALPKPKTVADLSDAERQKLAALLGVAPDKLKAKAK